MWILQWKMQCIRYTAIRKMVLIKRQTYMRNSWVSQRGASLPQIISDSLRWSCCQVLGLGASQMWKHQNFPSSLIRLEQEIYSSSYILTFWNRKKYRHPTCMFFKYRQCQFRLRHRHELPNGESIMKTKFWPGTIYTRQCRVDR